MLKKHNCHQNRHCHCFLPNTNQNPPPVLASNPFLLSSIGIGSQGKSEFHSSSNNVQSHPALRGNQQLYQQHQYANYNNNNNNSSGRLSANSQSGYTASPGNHNGVGNYLQQPDNYPGQQTSRGYLGSSSSSSGGQQQRNQTSTPISRRENLSQLDNGRSASRWETFL